MAEGLAGCDNAVLLPHLGSATRATRSAMARIAAENIVAVLEGRRPAHLINPAAPREPGGSVTGPPSAAGMASGRAPRRRTGRWA